MIIVCYNCSFDLLADFARIFGDNNFAIQVIMSEFSGKFIFAQIWAKRSHK